MKKEIQYIRLRNDREKDIDMFANFSHIKFNHGGIILSSNKGLGLGKVFITYEDVAFVIYKLQRIVYDTNLRKAT